MSEDFLTKLFLMLPYNYTLSAFETCSSMIAHKATEKKLIYFFFIILLFIYYI